MPGRGGLGIIPAVPGITALITILIIDRPMCVDCIASRAQITPATVRSYLHSMTKTVDLRRGVDRCRSCGQTGETVALSKESGPGCA